MFSKIFLGMTACFALANYACAANKTHVTDMLGAGKSRVDVSISSQALKLTGNIFSAGQTISFNGKVFGDQLAAAYAYGVTDRLDIGLMLPLYETATVNYDYTSGANTMSTSSKYQGQGDLVAGAFYLLMDKQKDRMSWLLSGMVSPSTAPSDHGSSEVVVNGAVAVPGKTGKSGRGFRSISIGTALSFPTSAGDIYLLASLAHHGEENDAGVKSKSGRDTSLALGIESMLDDTTTLTPYVRYVKTAAGYHDTAQSAPYSAHDVGLRLTDDVTNDVSVQIEAEYNVLNDITSNYANGDRSTNSGKGYTFTLSTVFFF